MEMRGVDLGVDLALDVFCARSRDGAAACVLASLWHPSAFIPLLINELNKKQEQ